MNHKAIYALYPNVVSVDDDAGAFDAQGNQVQIDMALVNAWVDPEAYKELRRNAYIAEADALFFKAQRGEATMQEWQAKVTEIKNRFPKE